MGFYKNIRSDVSYVKQITNKIFVSRRHTCRYPEFICIFNYVSGFWYHVYRIDDFTMKFVRCSKTYRSNGSTFGPSYHIETDEAFTVSLIDMLNSKNTKSYQLYTDYTKRFKQDSNVEVQVCLTSNDKVHIRFFINGSIGRIYTDCPEFVLDKIG